MELPQRFWDKVDKNASGGCWLWTGAKQEGGRTGSGHYQGRFKMNDKVYLTHKISYCSHIRRSFDAGGLVVRHKCRNDLCVNPEHLELGTQKQNGEDTIRDGTSTRGEKHGRCKLTEQQVREILSSPKGACELGRDYGVSQSTISKITTRVSWYWLEKKENGQWL